MACHRAVITTKHVVQGTDKLVLTVRGADGRPVVGTYDRFEIPDLPSSLIPTRPVSLSV